MRVFLFCYFSQILQYCMKMGAEKFDPLKIPARLDKPFPLL